jgi:hypothetical protein
MRQFSIIFFLAILFASCDCNQIVSGTILDKETGKPLNSITVYKKNKSWVSTKTDTAGHFELSNISGGYGCPPMTIIVDDYNYHKVEVSIDAGSQKEIQLEKTKEFHTDKFSQCPTVNVLTKLSADTFKFGKSISVKIILTNQSKSIQSVWFDKPKSSTGGPAWTSVSLINKNTGKSVLKYHNKAILQSQLYSTEEVKKYSYQLKPGQSVSSDYNLLDLVVLLDNEKVLNKGIYEIQLFYCDNASNKTNFTID